MRLFLFCIVTFTSLSSLFALSDAKDAISDDTQKEWKRESCTYAQKYCVQDEVAACNILKKIESK